MTWDSDCLIIGAGPAGLTAAIYLSRFHLDIRVIDDGRSRALWIPESHNHAGFPDGVSGTELLLRMRAQAERYGTRVSTGRVTRLEIGEAGFEAEWGEGVYRARTVLLATGVENRRPSIDEALHDDALAQGALRYCPVCDGYEVTDKEVAVIGTAGRGVGEATFLRSYTANVTLIAPDGAHALDEADAQKAADYGIALVDGPAHVTGLDNGRIVIDAAGSRLVFDSVYPALGSNVRSNLAVAIGAQTNDTGCITVDSHQRTTIPGLYAAGDVVIGLDQISHAMGEAGVAATTIRNDIAGETPLLR